jgi:hypothetical protein
MVSGGTSQELTLRGIVIPTAWDHLGVALQVAILTADEDEYDIAEGGVGWQLLQQLREEVEARVRVDQVDRACQRVTVLDYRVLDTYNPDNDFLTGLKEPNGEGW